MGGSPKIPQVPNDTGPPPDRADAQAASQMEAARARRGRRSTIIAGAEGASPALGGSGATTGGSNSILGGGDGISGAGMSKYQL